MDIFKFLNWRKGSPGGIFFGLGGDKKPDKEKMAETIKVFKDALQEAGLLGGRSINEGLENKLWDFHQFRTQQIHARDFDDFPNEDRNPHEQPFGILLPPVAVEVRKPKDLLPELDTVPNPAVLEGLDEKIELLQDKTRLTNHRHAKAELKSLITRLTNRKRYKEFEPFFGVFPNTTDEKIDALVDNYKYLRLGEADTFVPDFPKDAIEIMKRYTEKVKELCNEEPVFYVIAEEKDFHKVNEKRDPILLVQSPFGFYWQILGAWDKEMMLLSEL